MTFKRTIRRVLFSAISSSLWKTEIANPPLPNQHAVAILLAIYAGRVFVFFVYKAKALEPLQQLLALDLT